MSVGLKRDRKVKHYQRNLKKGYPKSIHSVLLTTFETTMFMKISTLIASACFYAKSFLLVLRSILLRLSVPIYFAWQLIKQTSERTQSLRNSHSLRRKSKICSFCLACKIQADALRKDGSNEIYN